MTAVELQERILSISHVEAQQDRLVNELIQSMIEVNLDRFEKVLNNFIAAKGIEKAITFLIFPFLEKVGILWLTNHINPAQEHLVTNIIRQKIIVGIDKIATPLQSKNIVLLFLPEGEHHELGLLYMHYILKNRGIKVIYLGASIPVKDISFIVNHEKVDYLYTHLTSVAKNFHFDRFLENVSTQIPKTPLIISGYLAGNWQKKVPPTVRFKKTIAEVMDYVNSL
jgi:methanogenic corrinoid protein MtbC1